MISLKQFIGHSKHLGLDYAVIRNWHQPTPSIREFRELYDFGFEEGRVSIKERRYPESFKVFLDEAIKAYPDVEYEFFLMECPTFRNLDPDAGTYLHTDPTDTIHWQCRGVSEWFIGPDLESIILEPGDLLWFKAQTQHRVENLTEKYALIFAESSPLLFHDQNGNYNG